MANIMVAVEGFEDLVRVAGDSGKVNAIVAGAGMSRNLPEIMKAYPMMKYFIIVSSSRAAKTALNMAKRVNGPMPGGFYFEGGAAGGHLGFPTEEAANNPENSNVERIRGEIEGIVKKFNPELNIPVFVGGGVAYRKDIDHMFSVGGNGIVLGTRTALTDESGIPNDVLKQDYLGKGSIQTGKGSPTRLISTSVLSSEFEEARIIEDVVKLTMQQCVSCIGHKNCAFRQQETDYCIAHWLTETMRGRPGLRFTGQRLQEIRLDAKLYRNPDGSPRIPTVSEMIAFVINPANEEPSQEAIAAYYRKVV